MYHLKAYFFSKPLPEKEETNSFEIDAQKYKNLKLIDDILH